MAISLASEVCLGFLENKYRAKTAAQLGVLLQNAYPAQYLKYEDTVLYCSAHLLFCLLSVEQVAALTAILVTA